MGLSIKATADTLGTETATVLSLLATFAGWPQRKRRRSARVGAQPHTEAPFASVAAPAGADCRWRALGRLCGGPPRRLTFTLLAR